ncbi:unnamed protein product [Paramecium pentaurelia]|uniref:Potassium channel domain-containing protein n=1 Tax=Paramecium pentaurelia TaxID=43138 RepID=A0A8S1YD52_9CILI|nr:unnamed protein product [Paramecium pentaurelia]
MKGRRPSQSGKVSERSSRRQLENEQLVKKPDFLKAATLGQIFVVCTQQLGGLEDGKITKLQFRKFLMTEQICFVFNLMGLGLSVMQYDLEFEEEDEDISSWLLWIIFISTLTLLVLTVLRYQQHMNWLKSRKQISQNDKIWQTEQWYPMLIELIIYCIIPYPFTIGMRVYFYNSFQDAMAYYHVNEILALIMITRTVFIFRTILAQTFWYSNRTQRVCNLYACEGNYMFVAKSLMRTSPYTSQFIALVSLICIFGYGVRICENPLARNDPANNNLGRYANALWNIIITITTVGYGDFYTRTDLGRFVIFVVCILGIFVISVMVVTLINSLVISTLESHAITVLERIQLRQNLTQSASQVVLYSLKIFVALKKGNLSKVQLKILLIKLRKNLNDFKISRRQYRNKQDVGNMNEEITNQFSLLKSDFSEVIEKQKGLLQQNQDIMNKLGVEAKPYISCPQL